MITIDETPKEKKGGTHKISFTGLSTDQKPTETYEGMKIANGSSFFEMDTKTFDYYDESSKSWV